MKCPKCGTSNGKTNKFCRSCGLRLEGLIERETEGVLRQAQDEGKAQDGASCAPDEVALGEELFEVWQLYSAGELEAALGKLDRILVCTPESASAHNILALIYERKAEARLKAGAIDESRDLLKLAIEQYERIIDLNPDSAADREKLASLRTRMAGGDAAPPGTTPVGFKAVIRAVPPQGWAAAGFVFILVLAIMLVPGGGNRPFDKLRTKGEPARAAASAKGTELIKGVSTPGAIPVASEPSGLRAYIFPQARNTSASAFTPTPLAPLAVPRLTIPNEPARLPSLPADVKIVLESKGPAKKADASPIKPRTEKPTTPTAPEQSPSSTAHGSTALAQAIQLHNQGSTDNAVSYASQAITYFQADIDAGRNTVEARRGVENARKLIRTWQEPASNSQQ